MPPALTSYDHIPYRSAPFPQTRPDRLAAIARLFGLESPSPQTARVLELGCGAGANLIAMAHDHPGGSFLGIDASARQIADGWTVIQSLGLKNIELRHLDIAEVNPELGQFDYVICHGVYSWVPADIQNKILAILREHLAPNGVGYVSYNTYPGWHIRGIVRDMMRFHGTQFPDPATQLAQAKALVQFVAETGPAYESRYKQLLRDELETITRSDDSYLHHEHLEENNQPVYFQEFAKRLGANGLQFLGEAEFSTMVASNFAPEIADTLRRIGAHDILQMEQYMDFVRCRYFRQSLICNRAIVLNRQLAPDVVKPFWFSSFAVPTSQEPDLSADRPEEFRLPSGSGLICRHPLIKAALLALGRIWPGAMAFDELLAKARVDATNHGVDVPESEAAELFASDLLTGMAAGVIEWRLAPLDLAHEVPERPLGSRLARFQAQTGLVVTNLRGEFITLDSLHRELLKQADGTRTHEELTESVYQFIVTEQQVLRRDGDDTPVTDPAEAREILRPAVAKALANLARSALLFSPMA